MSFLYLVVGAVVLVAGYAAYQLYKAKKAVTAAAVEAQVKADAAPVVAKVKSDLPKI